MKFKKINKLLPITLLLGCNLAPEHELPEVNIPCNWHSVKNEEWISSSPTNRLWWENFNDPILSSLIDRAGTKNLDLQIAATRILQVRREKKGKAFENYPHIDGSVAFGHVYNQRSILDSLLKHAVKDNARGSNRINTDFLEVGFDAEWEIDFFGRIAHELKALNAKIESAEESLCDLWVTLTAEIARNYIELRSAQQRLDLLEENISVHEDLLYLHKVLENIGQISAIDTGALQEALYQIKQQKPLLDLSIAKSIHHLSILLGQSPHELFEELQNPLPIPCLPTEKTIGVPSELLRRRPDIRKAEKDLAAATERVSSAIAALFPRFSIRGFIGDVSTCIRTLLNPSSGTWFAESQLLLPIFNSRLLQQDVDVSKLNRQEAFYNYQKAVYLALEETENAIASFNSDQEKLDLQTLSLYETQKNLDLTKMLYDVGDKDYITVQEKRRSYLTARDNLLQSQVALLMDYISIYKAIGGGWEEDCNESNL